MLLSFYYDFLIYIYLNLISVLVIVALVAACFISVSCQGTFFKRVCENDLIRLVLCNNNNTVLNNIYQALLSAAVIKAKTLNMISEINVHLQTFHLICWADKIIVKCKKNIFNWRHVNKNGFTVFWMCMRHMICSLIYAPSSVQICCSWWASRPLCAWYQRS